MSNTPSVSELITRDQFESYVTIDSALALIGDGFTTLKESKNPKEYTRKYVNMKTEKTDVIGYAPSLEYSLDVYSNSPVVALIVAITDEEKTGSDATVTITNVNRWDADQSGKCKAVQRTYAVIPSGKGDGTDALIYSGTMKATSDIIKGKFDPTSSTFTADT